MLHINLTIYRLQTDRDHRYIRQISTLITDIYYTYQSQSIYVPIIDRDHQYIYMPISIVIIDIYVNYGLHLHLHRLNYKQGGLHEPNFNLSLLTGSDD